MKANLPKIYIDFIENCKTKNYGELLTHKHHILPKFMGGTNESDNLIVLSVEDHFLAHKLLAENCDDEFDKNGNKMSAAYIAGKYKTFNVTKQEIGNLIREAKKEYYKNNEVWNKGKKGLQFHTEEIKKKISKAGMGRTAWNKGLTKYTDERVKKYGETSSKTIRKKTGGGTFTGKKHTEESKEKMRKNWKGGGRHGGFSGSSNPMARKCIDTENGIVYGCIKEMANILNIPRTTLSRWIKNDKIKKYSYYE